MSDQAQTDLFDTHAAERVRRTPSLPPWLRSRVLGAREKLSGVYGPRFNPSWERYVTHPALFLIALALGALWVLQAWLFADTRPDLLPVAVLAAGGLLLVSIFILGLSCGYFTRVVVTDCRLVILQGYEVCRSWSIQKLPPSLIGYHRGETGEMIPSINLDTLHTMLGCASDKVVDAKTITAFSKHLEGIQARDPRRP
jgi:hypothetical protein